MFILGRFSIFIKVLTAIAVASIYYFVNYMLSWLSYISFKKV